MLSTDAETPMLGFDTAKKACQRLERLIDERRPTGFAAMGVFLFFGATMASLAAITLLWRGTVLDRAWRLNPTAYQQLAPLGSRIGTLFLFLGAALLVAGIGWFLRRRWAWRLTILIIGTQIVGDFVNLVRGDWLRGATGVIIAGALMLYLLSPRIRAAFGIQT